MSDDKRTPTHVDLLPKVMTEEEHQEKMKAVLRKLIDKSWVQITPTAPYIRDPEAFTKVVDIEAIFKKEGITL